MSNRHDPTRKARVREREERRTTLRVLLGRLDRLSAAEAALLLEYVTAELDASDELRRRLIGLEQSSEQIHRRIRAAEDAIVEAEVARDRLAGYLNAVRRELGGEVLWPDVPYAVRRLVADRPQTARAHPEEL
ncbi:hypothetical protein GCM10010497_45840 [Streptomyces cinereoruber]|uniref:Uncharacterized protein n=1 Tax=Streptomyces cinereoruber TaxID=67260 RepID=A0AAV4KLS2_9ACTN|nr:hypothetical protein [Streptomyces cinereoruber]MBB4160053.1 hypothetical protein [Streptomyces cinereoruber]MBY8818335.1 hypothetical protein [Streptomyces cinereoruber]NIH60991.1 hypothetical protein [Streptomyces cinereoruber]QEV33292.1 hypothetical protein CP977_14870 [Streptomyces cinereoruber]GGR37809.1 hypothetical protein GCM10010497_45840 [Streptomyces cinereoruber]